MQRKSLIFVKNSVMYIRKIEAKSGLKDGDEAIYRYNTRETSQSERFCDMFAKSLGIVTYRDVRRTVNVA